MFIVESYRITDNSQGENLKAGDYIFVNKLKGKNNPGRNRLVLYKSPLRRDALRPPLFIGRCIGIAGDTIQMSIEGFRVNGQLLPDAPMMQPMFRINKSIRVPLLNTLDSLGIPLRNIKEDSVSISLRMSLSERELLIKNLTKVVPIDIIGEYQASYKFIIPRRGKTIDINDISLTICSEAIMNETGGSSLISDGKLYLNGKEVTSFTFKKDYFWILSENETSGIDSRHLGLIPKENITGNIIR